MNEPDQRKSIANSPPVSADAITPDLAGGSASTGGSYPSSNAPADDLPTVPGYRVVGEIARGGMGRVLAAHDLTLERDVALKILLSGANADRFVRESKITARLPHPGIPPVHALGMLADGSPFLAMKLVAGQTLHVELKSADRSRLLQSFTQVCQAVGFAHSRGVIHRDLKPANVMVGAFGEVQVMDWGLAKDLHGEETPAPRPSAKARPTADIDRQPTGTVDYSPLPESTDDRTQAGQVMGTPAYMAPEQPRGEAVDARADVFALGGILCAILTGKPPFSGKSSVETIRRAAAADLAEAHARLDGCGEEADLVALCRRCLSPNPADRPADGQAVADALTAHVNGVQQRLRAAEIAGAEANERTRAERRTRRIQMIAAGLLLLVLAGGVVGTSIGLFKARRAQEQAEFAEGEEKKRADKLQKVSGYQANMLRQVDPADAGMRLMADLRARHAAALEKGQLPAAEKAARRAAFDRELHAVNGTDAAVAMLDRTVLAPAVQTIEAQFADQPLVDASLRATLGSVYKALGRYRESLDLYQRSYDERRAGLGEDHVDTLTARAGVGRALGLLQHLAEAERTIRATLEAYERVLGPDHPDTLNVKVQVAQQMQLQGKYDDAISITRDILERRRRVLGNEHAETIETLSDLGRFLIDGGKYTDATKVLREVVDVQRRTGDSRLAASLASLGHALQRQEEYAAAEPYIREALELRRQSLGEDHPTTLGAMSGLASLLMQRNNLTEAEPLAKELVDKSRRVYGNEHASTLAAINIMGQVLFSQNKNAETEPYYREALETGRRVLGEDHPDTIVWIANYGYLLRRLGRFAEAEKYLREALDKNRKRLGENHPYTVKFMGSLAETLGRQKKLAEAESYLRPYLEAIRRTDGETHPNTLSVTRRLADILRQQNKLAEAESYLRPLLETVRRQDGEDHSDTMALLGILGAVLRDQGKLADAEPFFQRSLDANRRRFGDEHAETITAVLRIGSLRVAQRKYAEALAVLTPVDGKVTKAMPGTIGVLRNASLVGMIGKCRGKLAKDPAEFAAAEAKLVESQGVFAKNRGDMDVETRKATQDLIEFYAAWDKADPGKGHDARAAAWKDRLAK
jgi:tetratricopeptide (TPR) repeat protein